MYTFIFLLAIYYMMGLGCSIAYEMICKQKQEKESRLFSLISFFFWPAVLMIAIILYLDKHID